MRVNSQLASIEMIIGNGLLDLFINCGPVVGEKTRAEESEDENIDH